jgi:cytidylate kinase
MVITIDGPAGSGKSTAARLLAKRLNGQLLDTGAIYRCLALEAGRRSISTDEGARLAELARRLDVRFEPPPGSALEPRVFLGGREVTEEIRTGEVSRDASVVSAHPEVREALLELQRRLAREAGGTVVAEGRDMGTVVFADAAYKFFLVADPKERARRRHEELRQRGQAMSFEEVLRDQKERDERDRSRSVSPLMPADDAVTVDSSKMTPRQVVDFVIERIAREEQ